MHDGFVNIQFSDPARGLHGCTPAEVLHAFQMGLAERSIEICFEQRKLLKQKRKGSAQSHQATKKAKLLHEESSDSEADVHDQPPVSDDDSGNDQFSEEEDEVASEVMAAITSDDTSRLQVFSKEAKKRVDMLARKLHRHLAWQSEKDLPRTTFPNGITKLTKMQGNERTGVLLLPLMILVMEHWACHGVPLGRNKKKPNLLAHENGHLEQALGSERAANMVKALALLILFESFMRWHELPRAAVREVKPFLPAFLDQVFRSFNRIEGTGNNLMKNHLPLHLCDDTERFGSPQNTNSGPGEKLHQVSVKEPGRRTNMQARTFEAQCAKRCVENLTISRSYLDHPNWADESALGQDTNNGCMEPLKVTHHGRFLSVHKEHFRDNVNRRRESIPEWGDSHVTAEEALGIVRDSILPRLKAHDHVDLFTKTNRNGMACGERRLSKQDWALIRDEQNNDIPSHLLCFFELPETLENPLQINDSSIQEKGHCAMIHQVSHPLMESGDPLNLGEDCGTRAHLDQHLIHRMPKWRHDGTIPTNANPATLLVVPCDATSDTCVGFPDILSENPRNEFFFLASVKDWPHIFVAEAKRHKME